MPFDVFFSTDKIDAYARAIENNAKIKDSAARLLAYQGLARRKDRELATPFGRFIRDHAHKLVVGPGAIGASLLIFSPLTIVGMIASGVAAAAFITDNAMTFTTPHRLLSASFKARDRLQKEKTIADYSEMKASPKLGAVMDTFPDLKERFDAAALRDQHLSASAPAAQPAAPQPPKPTTI